MPPLPGFGSNTVDPSFMGGVNSMQWQAGLMPGGLPSPTGLAPTAPLPPPVFAQQNAPTAPMPFAGMAMTAPLPPPVFAQIPQTTPMFSPMMGSGMFPGAQNMPFAPMGAMGSGNFILNAPSISMPSARAGQGVSPFPRPPAFTPFAPISPIGGAFGNGRLMGQQSTGGMTNTMLAGTQAAAGLGARFGAGSLGMMVGGALGTMVGMPFLGAMAGGAVADWAMGDQVQNLGEAVLDPFVGARMRTTGLQTSSLNYLRRGPDLAPGGQGLSLGASRRLQHGLMDMADSRDFQRGTGGRFNRQDVMRITQLAGDLGMLDQSQTAQEVAQSVNKISRALANVMKIAGEPDFKKAMQMMSQMRSAGMSLPETQVAMQNARTFARMAGMSVGDVVSAGSQGASMYQAAGMTAASGMTAGMGAVGMAGIMSTTLSPRALALAGGREGIQQNLMEGSARAASLTPYMFAALKRDGRHIVPDMERLNEILQGRVSISEGVQQTARNLGGMKNLQEVISTRGGELRDEMQRMMGPVMQTLLPIIQAQQVQKQMGVSFGAALRITGQDEQGARAIEQSVASGDFWRGLNRQLEQQKIDQRQAIRAEREATRDRASQYKWTGQLGMGLGRSMRAMGTDINEYMAEWDEESEATAEAEAQGGSLTRFSRAPRTAGKMLTAEARDIVARGGTRMARPNLSRFVSDAMRSQQKQVQDNLGDQYNWFNQSWMSMSGPSGWGLSRAARGGLTMPQLIMDQMNVLERAQNMVGLGEFGFRIDKQEADKYVRETVATGKQIEHAAVADFAQRRADTDLARKEIGKLQINGVNVDERKFNAVTSRAVTNLLSSARSNWSGWQKSTMSEQEIDNALLDAAAKEGLNIKDPAVKNAVLSPANRQNIWNRARRNAGPKEKEVLDNKQSAAGELVGWERANTIDAVRELGTKKRADAVKNLGIQTVFSDAEVKLAGDIISGATEGEEAKTTDMKQRALRLSALRQKRDDIAQSFWMTDQDEKDMEAFDKQINALEAETEEKYGDTEEWQKVQEGVSGMLKKYEEEGGDVEAFLSKVGTGAMADKTGAKMREAGKEVTQKQIEEAVVSGAVGVLGGAGQTFLSALTTAHDEGLSEEEAQKRAYTAVAKDTEEFKGLSKEVQDLVSKAAGGDKAAQDELNKRQMDKAVEGAATAISGDTNTPGQDKQTGLQKTIDEIQQQAKKLGTDEFTVATGKFSEASQELLKAAQVIQGKDATKAAVSDLQNANPIGPAAAWNAYLTGV